MARTANERHWDSSYFLAAGRGGAGARLSMRSARYHKVEPQTHAGRGGVY